MLIKSTHLKSISVYRSEIGEDYKVSIELLNGASWCGFFPTSYDEEHILKSLQQRICEMQTPGQQPVTHKENND